MKKSMWIMLFVISFINFNYSNNESFKFEQSPQNCFDAAINMYDAVIAAGFDRLLASKEADVVYDTCMIHLVNWQ
ncbi:MAG: hypothetical protein RQ756_03880 [Flavobacteriaceae bacterium]|nr:hypothetical protein [Flavobacteriaceae bacterium]